MYEKYVAGYADKAQKCGAVTHEDYDKALQRFVGMVDLFGKYIGKFISDDNFAKIKPAFDSCDYEAALNATHTLKGVSGNMGMTRLYAATSNTVALIRAKKYDEAIKSYDELSAAYTQICDVIRSLSM